MAKAPKPGARRSDGDVTTITITISNHDLVTRKGRPIPATVVVCAPPNVPLAEEMACRKQTGFPPEYWLTDGQINLTSVKVWWWLARRAQGEKNLAWAHAEEEWPEGLDADDLDFEIDEPDPEASDPEA